MSSNTPGSQQRQIIKSGPSKVGCLSGSAHTTDTKSLRPELMGKRFGRVEVCSPEVIIRKKNKSQWIYVNTVCVTCGRTATISLSNLQGGRTGGCRPCGQPARTPRWLTSRMASIRQRCTNPKDRRYMDYGGRGIEFRFKTVLEGCLWVQENIGLYRNLQLDRIDNDGHYEPGNIRWSNGCQNQAHTRRSKWAPLVHAFKLKYPHVRYADNTLSRLIANFQFEEIERRWNTPSFKPKGVYGTFSTPDHFIASLYQGS